MVEPRSATPSARGRSVLMTGAAAALLAAAALFALLRVTSLGSIGELRLGAGSPVMTDFKSTVYYPAKAYADGINPYDAQQYLTRYPAPEPLRLYPPATLLVFRPFAWLPLDTAMAVQACLTLLLSGVLAYVSLRLARLPTSAAAVLLVWGLILLSRPGQWNLLQGQMTLLIVLGVYAAFAAGRISPVVAGIGLALSLLKPNFGLPTAALMLARGHYRGAAIGIALTAVLNLVTVASLATQSGGLFEFGRLFLGTGDQLRFGARLGTELNVFRVDGVGFITRLLGVRLGVVASLLAAALFLGLVAALLRRRQDPLASDRQPDSAVAGLLCCGVLIGMYHIGYDLLLLTWPCLALVKDLRGSPHVLPARRWVQAGLLGLLAFNYVTTFAVLGALHAEGALFWIVASLNGAALTALFALYLWDVLAARPSMAAGAVPLAATSQRRCA